MEASFEEVSWIHDQYEAVAPKECVIDEATPEALADACEHALQTDWEASPIILPQRTSSQTVGQQWSSLLEGPEEEE